MKLPLSTGKNRPCVVFDGDDNSLFAVITLDYGRFAQLSEALELVLEEAGDSESAQAIVAAVNDRPAQEERIKGLVEVAKDALVVEHEKCWEMNNASVSDSEEMLASGMNCHSLECAKVAAAIRAATEPASGAQFDPDGLYTDVAEVPHN